MASYKIVVLGGGGVGKSALTIQLVQQNFIEEYDPTIEDSYRKQTNIDGKTAYLEILDTAGQDEYALMREQYMLGGEGFLIVYAINSRNSFTEVREFCDLVRRVKDEDHFPTVVVGNKCDLSQRQRKVMIEEGEELCKEFEVPFFESSAKVPINVEEAFFQLVREIRVHKGEEKKGGKGKKGRLMGRKECTLL